PHPRPRSATSRAVSPEPCQIRTYWLGGMSRSLTSTTVNFPLGDWAATLGSKLKCAPNTPQPITPTRLSTINSSRSPSRYAWVASLTTGSASHIPTSAIGGTTSRPSMGLPNWYSSTTNRHGLTNPNPNSTAVPTAAIRTGRPGTRRAIHHTRRPRPAPRPTVMSSPYCRAPSGRSSPIVVVIDTCGHDQYITYAAIVRL